MNFEASQLQETLHLINLIYYRNKNQHRHQNWWKWLSIFRRNVRAIVTLLEAEQERRRDLLNGVRRATAGEKERDRKRLEQTVGWMKRIGVERCWLAFTSLVSDTQFSVLGVVLIAILARFAKVIGYKPTPETPQQLSSIAKVYASDPSSSRQLPSVQVGDTTMIEADVGVAISRDQVHSRSIDVSPATATKAATGLPMLPTATTSQSTRISSSALLRSQTPPIRPQSKGKKRKPFSNISPVSEPSSSSTQLSLQSSTQPAAEDLTMHGSSQPSKSQPKPDPSSRKKKKKSKGGGNAIDDLFAGLT